MVVKPFTGTFNIIPNPTISSISLDSRIKNYYRNILIPPIMNTSPYEIEDNINYIYECIVRYKNTCNDLSNSSDFEEFTFFFHPIGYCKTDFSSAILTDDKVNENIYGELNVFPNPFNEIIKIETKENISQIIVQDVLGKTIYSEKNIDLNYHEIKLPNIIPKGIYWLKINNQTIKILKK